MNDNIIVKIKYSAGNQLILYPTKKNTNLKRMEHFLLKCGGMKFLIPWGK